LDDYFELRVAVYNNPNLCEGLKNSNFTNVFPVDAFNTEDYDLMICMENALSTIDELFKTGKPFVTMASIDSLFHWFIFPRFAYSGLSVVILEKEFKRDDVKLAYFFGNFAKGLPVQILFEMHNTKHDLIRTVFQPKVEDSEEEEPDEENESQEEQPDESEEEEPDEESVKEEAEEEA
jgi:hypothetical protein